MVRVCTEVSFSQIIIRWLRGVQTSENLPISQERDICTKRHGWKTIQPSAIILHSRFALDEANHWRKVGFRQTEDGRTAIYQISSDMQSNFARSRIFICHTSVYERPITVNDFNWRSAPTASCDSHTKRLGTADSQSSTMGINSGEWICTLMDINYFAALTQVRDAGTITSERNKVRRSK